jgi:biotin synthase
MSDRGVPAFSAIQDQDLSLIPKTRRDVLQLLDFSEEEARNILFPSADRLRGRCVGNEVFLRGIVELSNICAQDCLYCGLRRSNKTLHRYRMTDTEILSATERIRAEGIGTVVLQSGEDGFFTCERLCTLVSRIKERTSLAITLSVGERSKAEYRAFRDAGADRYLLKFETSCARLYSRLRPGRRLSERLRCLADLRDLGFEVGTGNMIGLPGQTAEILAEDLMLMKDLDADMLGIGPFLPHPQTPLGTEPPGSVLATLKALAISRLLINNANIPATTALAVLDGRGRLQALGAGANIVMPDFTPPCHRRFYEIYPGHEETIDLTAFLRLLQDDIDRFGRKIGRGAGGRRGKQV